MPEIDIVLVEPLYDGNVGFAARVMKNFGFTRLVLINPCKLGEEAKGRASHAQDVLKTADVCTIEDVFARSNIVIATTGEVSKSVCHAMRMPFYSPKELRERIKNVDGRISILFGRENWGLNNEEVKRSDIICTIPTHEMYPILNLSHAVGVVCYEPANLPLPEIRPAPPQDMEYLYRHIDRYLDEIHHPDFKRENTMVLLRRVLGRCNLTIREMSTLHGLLRRSEWHIGPSLLDRDKTGTGNLKEFREDEETRQAGILSTCTRQMTAGRCQRAGQTSIFTNARARSPAQGWAVSRDHPPPGF